MAKSTMESEFNYESVKHVKHVESRGGQRQRQYHDEGSGEEGFKTGQPVQLKLNIGVIGGGIAGFSMAITLRDAGHNVEIFERSRSGASEVGAAVGCGANASKILRRWEFDSVKARGVKLGSTQIISATEPSTKISYTDLNASEKQYGAPFIAYHRVDLHAELRRLALERGATLRLASFVESVECETGMIVLRGGERVQKDLVVGADGVHSITTNLVTKDSKQLSPTGQSIFRALIPTEKLERAGLLEFMNLAGPDDGGALAVDPQRMLIWYPCRNGQVMNFAGVHPTRDNHVGVEDWYGTASQEEFLDEYKTFHPNLLKIIKQADDIKHWPLLYRQPIANWYNGKLVLCGDAAHPMLPHRGQGAAQAFEDAVTLGLALSNLSSSSTSTSISSSQTELQNESLSSKLALYQKIRKNRAATTQIFSNAKQPGQDWDLGLKEQVKLFYQGTWPETQQDFFEFSWGYDILEDSTRVLQQQQQQQQEEEENGVMANGAH